MHGFFPVVFQIKRGMHLRRVGPHLVMGRPYLDDSQSKARLGEEKYLLSRVFHMLIPYHNLLRLIRVIRLSFYVLSMKHGFHTLSSYK